MGLVEASGAGGGGGNTCVAADAPMRGQRRTFFFQSDYSTETYERFSGKQNTRTIVDVILSKIYLLNQI